VAGSSDPPPVQAEFCKAVIHIMPDFALAHRFLGSACIEMGRHAEAVEALKTAIRLQQDDDCRNMAYYQLGLAYVAMGNYAEAFRAYQALRRLDPALARKLQASIEPRLESTKQNPGRKRAP